MFVRVCGDGDAFGGLRGQVRIGFVLRSVGRAQVGRCRGKVAVEEVIGGAPGMGVRVLVLSVWFGRWRVRVWVCVVVVMARHGGIRVCALGVRVVCR